MATTARKLAPCTCRSFEFGTYDPDTEQDDTFDTNCTESTHRTFAQGHDAKLVGFLVRAELDGIEISQTDGGVRVTFPGAVNAAARISEALARKAEIQLEAAHRRAAKKAAAASHRAAKQTGKTARAEAKAEAAPEPKLVTAKVGRWTYEGAVGAVTGDFVYKAKLGGMKTAPKGSYTIVE